MLLQLFRGVQRHPVPSCVELLRGAVSQPAVLLQVRHPVISYYVWRIPLRRRRAKSEPWRGINLSLRRGHGRVQSKQVSPYRFGPPMVLGVQLVPGSLGEWPPSSPYSGFAPVGVESPPCLPDSSQVAHWLHSPSCFRFLLEVGTRRPVEALTPSGSDPSSDTVTTLSSSLSEETLKRPVDSLSGVRGGAVTFLFRKGNRTSIFWR